MPSRPTICWSDLAGATVGLWGLGIEGEAGLRRLLVMGVEPVLVDDWPGAGRADGREVLSPSGRGLDALARCDVVVKAPGVSRYRPEVVDLAERGVAVVGGLGLWLQEADLGRVVCITGTKGKSTTTAIAGHLLRSFGYRPFVGGNLGKAPFDPAAAEDHEAEDHDVWVIETSSFQAADLAVSPPVVAVTSLHPDHLDWHGDVDTYYRDKLSACTQPGAELTIADGASALLRERRSLLGPRVRWVEEGERAGGAWFEGLGLPGLHNVRNAAIARACLEALGVREAHDEGALRQAAVGFEQLESRLRPVGKVGSVDFVDDSLSTNVLPTLAALESFAGRPIALIAGGHDRGIDYRPLAQAIAEREEPTLVVTLPESGPRIRAEVERLSCRHEAVDCVDMAAAVSAAHGWCPPGGVVLLSPAAPSFGQFRNYRERSAAFAEAMRALAG